MIAKNSVASVEIRMMGSFLGNDGVVGASARETIRASGGIAFFASRAMASR